MNAGIALLGRVNILPPLGFDAREFKLLTKNLCKVVESYIDFKNMRSRLIASLANAMLVAITATDWGTGFTFTLTNTANFFMGVDEMRNIDARNWYAHQVLTFFTNQFAVGDILLQVFLDMSANNLL